MPLITVHKNNLKDLSFKDQLLAEELTSITKNVLFKDPELTIVQFHEVNSLYLDGKASISEPRLNIDIKITKGTNSSCQKQNWVNLIGKLIKKYIPDAPDQIFYISITEIESTDWGYSGKTQEQRKQLTQGAEYEI